MILDMEECNNNGSRWTTTSDGFIAERKCSTYKRHCDINYKYIFLNQTSNLPYQTLFTSNQNWNNKVFKEIFILIANIYLLCLFCVIKQPLLSPSRHRFGTLPSFSPYVAWDQHSSAEMTCSQWHRKYTTLKKLVHLPFNLLITLNCFTFKSWNIIQKQNVKKGVWQSNLYCLLHTTFFQYRNVWQLTSIIKLIIFYLWLYIYRVPLGFSLVESSSSTQSRGEYHLTKSSIVQLGLAALKDSMSDTRQALCIRARSWAPSDDVPSLQMQQSNKMKNY